MNRSPRVFPPICRALLLAGPLLALGWLTAVPARLPGQESPAATPPDHAAQMKAGLELFTTTVRSVLEKHCLECHGGKSTKADFSLATREALLESGLIEATAADSQLVKLITHAEEPHMPHKAPRLPDEQLAAIARWIDLGAPYDKPLAGPEAPPAAPGVSSPATDYWSFQPLRVVAPPAVRDASWVQTPIDRFVLARLEAAGIAPNPLADRRTLIRRASFDLLGLPPTPEQVEAFVGDPDPRAYERLVDELLASPHYGERWARHWLDIARFAESHGYEQDYDRPHAYHYRDFLIKAFNGDMPYDQFVRWQLAGDELAPDDPLALTATGFLGGGAFPTQLTEAEFESTRYDELDDMTATTGVALLGLSLGCARCHDHKFDPIPSADYYRFAASFTTTIRSEIDLTLEPGAPPAKVQVTSEGLPHMKHHADDRGFPHFYPETYILVRGDVRQKKEVASPSFLGTLMRGGKDVTYWQQTPPAGWTRTSYRRASLAAWLTDTQYGAGCLAARVMVNRLWQHHFGGGIVATPNDFGLQGATPTHPELLEWLAADLVHHGWKLKRLHKLIMTSAVYRQSSAADEARAAVDRENQLLWRRTPRRLEAEPIRDAMLAVSGLLETTMYGPGTLDANMRRRSIYFFIKRSQLIPMMMLFDWPEQLVSIGQRSSTTIAPQALMFLNNPQARQYAEGFARQLAMLPRDQWVPRGYALAFGRAPRERELQLSEQFLGQQQASHAAAGQEHPEQQALADFCQMLFGMNEFVYID